MQSSAKPQHERCPACNSTEGAPPDVLVAAFALVSVFGLTALRGRLCPAHLSALDLIVQRASAANGAQPLSRQQRRAQRRKGIVIL